MKRVPRPLILAALTAALVLHGVSCNRVGNSNKASDAIIAITGITYDGQSVAATTKDVTASILFDVVARNNSTVFPGDPHLNAVSFKTVTLTYDRSLLERVVHARLDQQQDHPHHLVGARQGRGGGGGRRQRVRALRRRGPARPAGRSRYGAWHLHHALTTRAMVTTPPPELPWGAAVLTRLSIILYNPGVALTSSGFPS